jgi:hypothetical protein
VLKLWTSKVERKLILYYRGEEGEPWVSLCNGASLYVPYSLLLISCSGWGGGKVGSRRGRSEGAELEGENKRGGGGVTLPYQRGWWGWGSRAVK